MHAVALVPVCENRVDRGYGGFSALAERVKGGLTTHFLTSRLDVGVDEGDRIIMVLVVRGQIMEHIKQLRASRGTIL